MVNLSPKQKNPSLTPPKDETLPTMYDLPSEFPEESGLPDLFHCFQPVLLSHTCRSPHYPRDNYLVASDFNIYYDRQHTLWHKRPDWFIVLGVDRARQQQDLRLSYVIWQERVSPYLVIELLSPSTEAEDLGQTERDPERPPTKWQVYEQILQVPYYVIYDRYENQFRAFHLQGNSYQTVPLPDNRLWLEELGLGLGLWQGEYEEIEGLWLRFYDREENWIPTPNEQADRFRQLLLENGIDPDAS